MPAGRALPTRPGLRVRLLGRQDAGQLLAYLDRNPVRDVFIASRVRYDGVLATPAWSPLWGAFDGNELRGVLHVGPNLVPAVDGLEVVDALAPAAARPAPTRMIVGERRAVERLWAAVAPTYPRPREVRRRQFVYVLGKDDLVVPPAARTDGRARYAAPADEEVVLRLSAAMHAEEVGEDPLEQDPAGYRRRVQVLIRRGWTFVYQCGDRLVFKMDVGCASDGVAQIQGVYVPPELRGQGWGTRGMSACCELALVSFPCLSLYVNDFNRPAIALYERIGFRRASFDFQTIMLP